MKSIIKGDEPKIFSAWKALANADWQPSYGTLANPEKKAVKQALMKEQGHICCYCERRLYENDSHIEHWVPQAESEPGALDFANMLCSCQQNLDKGTPLHCGNLKGDHLIPVSPFDPDCATRFIFTVEGEILAAQPQDQAAQDTIKLLGLDISTLNAMRARVIEPFLDESLEDDEFEEFFAAYLQPDADGVLGEFWTTIDGLFRR
jgi:uncharacterized protein (TIGR02646 family)